jgi:hypothetical protein
LDTIRQQTPRQEQQTASFGTFTTSAVAVAVHLDILENILQYRFSRANHLAMVMSIDFTMDCLFAGLCVTAALVKWATWDLASEAADDVAGAASFHPRACDDGDFS